MSYELDDLTLDELEELVTEARELISYKRHSEIKKAYIEVVQIAMHVGLSVDELIAQGRKHGRPAHLAGIGK